MTQFPSDSWWTRREAAMYAHVSEATIGREVRGGRLRHAKVGGRRSLRFKRDWLDEWLTAGRPFEPYTGEVLGRRSPASAPRYARTVRSSNVLLT